MALSAEEKEVIQGLVKDFSEKANMCEEQAKGCALRSIIGLTEHSENEKEQAERYYCQAKVWEEAKNITRRFL